MIFNLEKVNLVAFEDMNVVHLEELELVNKIHDYIEGKNSIDHSVLQEMLEEFVFHLRDHFLFEETMMKETNCPILSCHESEHKRVQKILFQILTEYGKHKNVQLLKFYFEVEFKSWIENHILTMDTVTGLYLKDPSFFENQPHQSC